MKSQMRFLMQRKQLKLTVRVCLQTRLLES